MAAEISTRVTGEIPIQLETTYQPLDSTKTYVVGCVDDRPPTAESAAQLVKQAKTNGIENLADPAAEGYVRVPGGLAGLAKITLITAVAQYGPKILKSYPTFEGFMKSSGERLKKTSKFLAALHLSCKAALIGVVSDLAAHHPTIRQASEQEHAIYLTATNTPPWNELSSPNKKQPNIFSAKTLPPGPTTRSTLKITKAATHQSCAWPANMPSLSKHFLY